MTNPPDLALPRYPVRLVATRTGLSPHVLRAWERRYHVVAPTRSDGGHRLYSDLDIQRLLRLRRLSEQGHSIGRIATLPLEALAQLDEVPPEESEARVDAPRAGDIRECSESAILATRRLDPSGLQTLLERAALTLGVPDFLDHVAAPVLDQIGRGWIEGSVSVAQEHMATAVFRRVFGWLLGAYEVKGAAPRLVVATLSGEMHEMGALMVAVSAAAEGWSVTYLGANLPVADLLQATEQSGADAVAISAVHAHDRPGLDDAIRIAREGLPPAVPLILGGAAASRLEVEPSDDVLIVDDLHGLRALLNRLSGEAVA